MIRSCLFFLAISALAPAVAAQTLAVSPSSFSRGDEAFLQISLTGLTATIPTDSAIVTFGGPGGVAALEPQFVADGYLVVWVPELAMNNPGTYAVELDVTFSGTTTHYGPAQITVHPLPDPATLPPALTLPEVVTAEAAGAFGAVVAFSATSSDGAAVSCTPASGATFPLGTSTVSCSAGSASGSFVVVVHDTVAPALTVPANITTSNPVVTYTATASDAIDPAPQVECTPSSGSTFSLGVTVVACMAIDHHANYAFRTLNVTVTNGAPVTISNVAVSEPFFSPNADGSKETTTVSANATSADTAWTVSVKSSSGATLLTANRSGAALTFIWDGRDNGGAVQPDGSYTFALSAIDGVYSANATASAVLDRTTPTATIASPPSGHVVSNIRGTSTSVTGTSGDTNLLDWTLASGPAGGTMTVLATGTSAVSSATLGTLNSASLTNGDRVLRLEVRDRAGNLAVATTNFTIAHFSASQNAYQANTATGGSVTYTSVVPFTVTETLTIRNSSGVIVRTLVNGSRTEGTYNDAWNGRNDSGALLPDGSYSYIITVTEGANTLTWDLSNEMRGATETQLPYPSCSAASMPLALCSANAAAERTYDPFANDPLEIHYSVAEPSRVTIVLTGVVETSGTCSAGEVCVLQDEYRAAGSYIERWAGVLSGGLYAPARSKLTVVRRTSTFPKNVVLLYGSGAAVETANLTITPSVYGPEGGSMNIEFDLDTFGNAPATVTLQMIRQEDQLSVLRKVTLASQTPGHVTYVWDGRADSGHWVAPGQYALVVTAEANGRSSVLRSRFVVVY